MRVDWCTELSASPLSQESLRRLPWCTCVSASASQSRAQCCARELSSKILSNIAILVQPAKRRIFYRCAPPPMHGPHEGAARRPRCPHHRDRSGAPSDWSRIARFDRDPALERRGVERDDGIRALF